MKEWQLKELKRLLVKLDSVGSICNFTRRERESWEELTDLFEKEQEEKLFISQSMNNI